MEISSQLLSGVVLYEVEGAKEVRWEDLLFFLEPVEATNYPALGDMTQGRDHDALICFVPSHRAKDLAQS